MIDLARAIVALAGLSGHVSFGMATGFAARGDKHNPVPHAACLGRDLDDARDRVVAHRSLPCRSSVLVCLLGVGRCVRAVVGDRLGTCRHSRCAEVDLAPATARALGLDWRRVYEPAVLWAQ